MGSPDSRKQLAASDFVDGVLSGDRAVMGRAITLVESNVAAHQLLAGEVLGALKEHAGNSVRIAVTGVPGVGKSTFIEAFGCHLIKMGKKVAVLAVDPSSTVTGGSILGDKTRMERLSREENCFIRPSPTGGALGGVGRRTMETLVICEAAGFDIVLIETVGVGQSEVTVRTLVDFFVLLMLPNAGDSLQGIKRGIMELADCIAVNKADGHGKTGAKVSQGELEQALSFMRPATRGWKTPVLTCSALEETNIDIIWSTALEFVDNVKESGVFEERRTRQLHDWFMQRLEQRLKSEFFEKPQVQVLVASVLDSFSNGSTDLSTLIDSVLEAGRK